MLARNARQQREHIRQVIRKLDQSSISSSKDVAPLPKDAVPLPKDVDPLPNSALQLSNPAFTTNLPFPFIGSAMPNRFQVSSNDNEKNWFYMGREKFAKLRDRFEDILDDVTHSDVTLYGTKGYGKSYLLAALVCYWAAGDRKVVYIPDCQYFIENPVKYMISAMLFAWADDKSQQQKIMTLKTLEDIYLFFQAQGDVIFVIDQLNALQGGENDNAHTASQKAKLLQWLDSVIATYKAICSSSANNYSILNNAPKQTNSDMMNVYGGLTRVSLKSNNLFIKKGTLLTMI